jgi:hypothetical protein
MSMRTGGGRAGGRIKGVRDKSGLIAWDRLGRRLGVSSEIAVLRPPYRNGVRSTRTAEH